MRESGVREWGERKCGVREREREERWGQRVGRESSEKE